jgi:hypothetical protein
MIVRSVLLPSCSSRRRPFATLDSHAALGKTRRRADGSSFLMVVANRCHRGVYQRCFSYSYGHLNKEKESQMSVYVRTGGHESGGELNYSDVRYDTSLTPDTNSRLKRKRPEIESY